MAEQALKGLATKDVADAKPVPPRRVAKPKPEPEVAEGERADEGDNLSPEDLKLAREAYLRAWPLEGAYETR